MNTLKISIIIPSFNPNLATFADCLKSINSSRLKPLEVIIVDDASQIKYPKKIESTYKIIKNKTNKGPAYSRNKGAKEARGDILCFIDSDVEINPDTLDKITEKFKNDTLTAVQTIYSTESPIRNFISQYHNLYQRYNYSIIKSSYINALSAYCFAIKKDIFFGLGGFDEKVKDPSTEDLNLGIKLSFRNYKIFLAKDIEVKHLAYFNIQKIFKRKFIMGRDWANYFLKDQKTRSLKLINTNHPSNLKLSIAVSPFILFSLIFIYLPIAKYVLLTSLFIFLISNFIFFVFLSKKKGFIFMLKSIIIHWFICLSIFLGLLVGGFDFAKAIRKN